jgi:hypothetical protein
VKTAGFTCRSSYPFSEEPIIGILKCSFAANPVVEPIATLAYSQAVVTFV